MTYSDQNMDAAKRNVENAAHDAENRAKHIVDDVTAQAKTVATETKDTILGEVSQRADAVKGAAATEVGNVAAALRKAAQESRSGSAQERTFGQIADTLADASDAISNKDLGTAISDIGEFARRNPLTFLAGAALAGFAVSRFVKASDRHSYDDRDNANVYTGDTVDANRNGRV
ncbi:hypothetical protein SAMN04488003_107109 [Loktanella fryxellensis]|uniref:Uncharacterized protein n=1 Tax=Loktanella fryxellensis TaxID=245187 RepID=A0A1H8CVQ8_9RHOB|nr:hypothetical protein [Loktanella fryxellensis]SEM98544.1 hypothetical protein SAMN04488003_107109 [Loktanella fryxellensis]